MMNKEPKKNHIDAKPYIRYKWIFYTCRIVFASCRDFFFSFSSPFRPAIRSHRSSDLQFVLLSQIKIRMSLLAIQTTVVFAKVQIRIRFDKNKRKKQKKQQRKEISENVK